MRDILFGLVAVGAGVAGTLQAAANAGLSARIGLGAALGVLGMPAEPVTFGRVAGLPFVAGGVLLIRA